jgi:hypothetical protein
VIRQGEETLEGHRTLDRQRPQRGDFAIVRIDPATVDGPGDQRRDCRGDPTRPVRTAGTRRWWKDGGGVGRDDVQLLEQSGRDTLTKVGLDEAMFSYLIDTAQQRDRYRRTHPNGKESEA